MAFVLPLLPYEPDALAPKISEQTLEFHYGKHHQAYVTNLNNLIPGTKFEKATLEQIVMEADGAIFNNGAQIWNHTFYFTGFSARPSAEPVGALADQIKKDFGSLSALKEQFTKSAATLFGSGWTWLVKKDNGTLEILQESNAGNPLKKGLKPVLTCDVWEHAYYLDYQNRRTDYIAAFWELVDWGKVAERY